MAAFNYNPIRNTALGLIKQFGRKVPCSLLRYVEGTAPDVTKPWRRDAPSVLEFKFIGIVNQLPFPALSEPISDEDTDIIVPGDIDTTGAVTAPGTLAGSVLKTDRIQSGSAQYGILGLQAIKPDDKTIMYKLRCRAWPRITLPQQTPF